MVLVIKIDPQLIGEIIYEIDSDTPLTSKINDSLYSAKMTDDFLDSVIRLVKINEFQKRKPSAWDPLYLKEILFKVINGEILRELAMNNRGFCQVSRVISKNP